jgi:single-strand DNA-binding protein
MKAHAVFRLGRDAEIRFLQSGEPVANLALATNVRKGKEEISVWVDASLWGKRAEVLAPMLLKGTQIMADLEGVHIETYQGKNGPTSKLVARVTDITLLGKKQDEQGSAPAPRPAPAPAPAPRPAPAFDVDDSDVPF